MVTRYYICDNCDHSFEFAHNSIHDTLKKKCPQCGKHKLYQDLTGQHTFVYQDPQTLGHLAERNTERMGKYDLEARRKKDEERNKLKQKTPTWYNKEGKNLKTELAHLNTAQKKHKYIMEGK